MGRFRVVSLQRFVGYPRFRALLRDAARFRARCTLIRSPFETAAATFRLRRAGLRKTRTFLENGVSGDGLLWLSTWILQDGVVTPRGACGPVGGREPSG